MMDIAKILDNICIERQRRIRGLLQPDSYALDLWGQAVETLKDDEERRRAGHAFTFAKNIKYRHVGLTSEIYFSHPVRVAALAVLVSGSPQAEVGVLALLHNVLEVSDVSEDELQKAFGAEVATQVAALTVNRAVQWDTPYKVEYYRRLTGGPRSSRIVKIIDKLDNLFLLGLNKNNAIKERYLNEIEQFLMPMTQVTLPHLGKYLEELVADCRTTCFVDPASK